jgi:uncharacterized membrane protein YuzA (DUF378 family)
MPKMSFSSYFQFRLANLNIFFNLLQPGGSLTSSFYILFGIAALQVFILFLGLGAQIYDMIELENKFEI